MNTDDESPNMGNHVESIVSANIDNVHNIDNIDSENTGSGYNMNDNIIHDEGTSSGHNNVKVDSDGESRKHEIKQVETYANAAKKVNDHIQNKLNFIPTIVKDLGNEVDIRCLSLPEPRYHLKRMQGRYGLKEIVDNANGCWLFKFGYEEEMNNVASSLGKPIIMDYMTANVCKNECNIIERTTDEITKTLKSNTCENTKGGLSVDGGKKDIENVRVDKNNMYNRANFEMERKQGTAHYNNWQAKKQWNKNKFNVENVGGSSKEKTFEEKIPKPPIRNDKKKALDDKMTVDQYLNKRIQPSCNDRSLDMIKYFKIACKAYREKERQDQEVGMNKIVEGVVQDVLEDEPCGRHSMQPIELRCVQPNFVSQWITIGISFSIAGGA
ncbi:hypothetical protein Tco_0792450 [Tanacetum coccineum]